MCKTKSNNHNSNHNRTIVAAQSHLKKKTSEEQPHMMMKVAPTTSTDQNMKKASTTSSGSATTTSSATSSSSSPPSSSQSLSTASSAPFSPTKSTKTMLSSSSIDPFQETLRAKSNAHHQAKKQSNSRNGHHKKHDNEYLQIALLLVIILLTIFTYPQEHITQGVSIHHVWYNGWITAVATGVGVLPFFFLSEPNKYWMGISNAIAGGMMLSASYSLIQEASEYTAEHFGILSYFYETYQIFKPYRHSTVRAGCGVVIGIIFIIVIKKILDHFEEEEEGQGGTSEGEQAVTTNESSSSEVSSTQRTSLIVIVMFLHSLTEGIGLGVSFGGATGVKLGQFITFSLAFHNVPEGLAVGLSMAGKTSPLKATLWAIFTSLPQPIFAVPAYIFIEKFAPLLPGGLGFAAGAMSYVAIFELLAEAMEDTSLITTGITGLLSFGAMSMVQELLKQSV